MKQRFRISTAVIVILLILLVSCSNRKQESFAGGNLFPSENTLDTENGKDGVGKADIDSKPVEETPNFQLVWSDEFDYEGAPDPDKWDYDVGGNGWGNNELQFYTKGDNVIVQDGLLVIEARKEQVDGMSYSSTRLVSRGKGDWLYGRVEVRAKLPGGLGTWPAIWMLPTEWEYGNWPASGEIDIMEHVGYDPGVVHGTVHTDRYNHMKGTQVGDSLKVETATTEFHEYAIEWYEERILFFIDGVQYFRFSPFVNRPNPGYKEWPFDQTFHLLINIAVGGNWGGAQGVDESIWPVTLEVDYVRVYEVVKPDQE